MEVEQATEGTPTAESGAGSKSARAQLPRRWPSLFPGWPCGARAGLGSWHPWPGDFHLNKHKPQPLGGDPVAPPAMTLRHLGIISNANGVEKTLCSWAQSRCSCSWWRNRTLAPGPLVDRAREKPFNYCRGRGLGRGHHGAPVVGKSDKGTNR